MIRVISAVILSIVLCAAGVGVANAANVKVRLNELVARILLQIPYYLTFDAREYNTLCIIGNDELSRKTHQVNATKEVFEKILPKAPTDGFNNCGFIYFEKKRDARTALTSKNLKHKIMLSNYSTFVDEGGVLAVTVHNGEIAIELNISAARRLGVTFNPDLIEISARVIK